MTDGVLHVVVVGTDCLVDSLEVTSFSDEDLDVMQQVHVSATTDSCQPSSLPVPCTSSGKARMRPRREERNYFASKCECYCFVAILVAAVCLLISSF